MVEIIDPDDRTAADGLSPDADLKCLMIQPRFAMTNYWNFLATAHAVGAKAMAPPLGLMTVAALLPDNWTFEIVDLNVCELAEAQWEKADVICVGGMIPQQLGILQIIRKARECGKYVVVGGPDPTSQPGIYTEADALVVGEGENTIPMWLESWSEGKPYGVFEIEDRPDVRTSRTPRFDLVDYRDYLHFGIQISRGCPFNCEFCDIIELYGRIPRSKTPDQVLRELEALYKTGYRGWVDISDDNFIGNKPFVKKLLVELATWSKERKYPFYFTTEATMNMADDTELLRLMRDVDFRWIFTGIETPDPDLLEVTQKRVNKMKPIVDRVNMMYEYGIGISAGFIVGFDKETPGIDQAMIDCINDTGIVTATVGLLTALPNTQLTRRLMRERRLIDGNHQLIDEERSVYRLEIDHDCEHTTGGLNFVTDRDRVDVYRDFRNVITTIYSPQNYMDRVLSTARRLKVQRKHMGSWFEFRRMVKGFVNIAVSMSKNKSTRRSYWNNTFRTALMGFAKFEYAQSMMSVYLHFGPQTKFIEDQLETAIDYAQHHASYPRKVTEDMVARASLASVKCSTNFETVNLTAAAADTDGI